MKTENTVCIANRLIFWPLWLCSQYELTTTGQMIIGTCTDELSIVVLCKVIRSLECYCVLHIAF